MKKVILLNSGGLDSACLAKWLKDRGFYIISVYVNTHGDNTRYARKAAQKTAEKFCNEHREIEVNLGMKSNYENRIGRPMGMPFLSNIVTILGLSLGRLLDIKEVYAALKGDIASEEFIPKTSSLLGDVKLVSWIPALILPFRDISRYTEVLERVGMEYKEVAYTHSCNAGKCGKCQKCKERKCLIDS